MSRSRKRVCAASVKFEPLKDSNTIDSQFVWSEPTKIQFTYPFKIFIPRSSVRSEKVTRWVYPVTYGGGLVSGDEINLEIECEAQCSVLVTSQAYNKIYKAKGDFVTRQSNSYTIQSGALLSILPDLMVCFEDSNYGQVQKIYLQDESSNLIYLDWFSSGRMANHERWKFRRLQNLLEIYQKDVLVLRESLLLENIDGLSITDRMKSFDVFGVLIIHGSTINDLKQFIQAESTKREEYGVKAESSNIFCSSLTSTGFCVVRFLCTESAAAYAQMEKLLTPMFDIYGGNPFLNKH